jgi:hypothetical protein
MIGCGFIKASQFIGVEINPELAAKNSQVFPHVALHNGDIVDVMLHYRDQGAFQPGFVNLDTQHEPKRAVALLSRVLGVLLSASSRNVLVVLNVVVSNLYRTHLRADTLHHIEDSQEVCAALLSGWKVLQNGYQYGGAGKYSKSTMVSYFLMHKDIT